MKKLIFTAFITFMVAGTALAQQTFSAEEFNKNLGNTGTLCDTVGSLRTFSDTLTLVNMGGTYPDQKYTIAVKGTKVTMDWNSLKGKHLCVTGVFEMYNGRPEIVVVDAEKISLH